MKCVCHCCPKSFSVAKQNVVVVFSNPTVRLDVCYVTEQPQRQHLLDISKREAERAEGDRAWRSFGSHIDGVCVCARVCVLFV